ncbi:hypothetical protein RCL1_005286 [Eukaryota sp. TZLM3-RCL]
MDLFLSDLASPVHYDTFHHNVLVSNFSKQLSISSYVIVKNLPIFSMTLTCNPSLVVIGGGDKVVRVCRHSAFNKQSILQSFPGHVRSPLFTCFHPSLPLVATADVTGFIRIFDVTSLFVFSEFSIASIPKTISFYSGMDIIGIFVVYSTTVRLVKFDKSRRMTTLDFNPLPLLPTSTVTVLHQVDNLIYLYTCHNSIFRIFTYSFDSNFGANNSWHMFASGDCCLTGLKPAIFHSNYLYYFDRNSVFKRLNLLNFQQVELFSLNQKQLLANGYYVVPIPNSQYFCLVYKYLPSTFQQKISFLIVIFDLLTLKVVTTFEFSGIINSVVALACGSILIGDSIGNLTCISTRNLL